MSVLSFSTSYLFVHMKTINELCMLLRNGLNLFKRNTIYLAVRIYQTT